MKISLASIALSLLLAAPLLAGEPVYAKFHQGAPDRTTGAQRALLRDAVRATFPSLVIANLDETACGTSTRSVGRREVTVIMCYADSGLPNVTAAQYWQARTRGGLSSSGTASLRMSYGPVVIRGEALAAWNAFSQSMWSKGMGEIYSTACTRADPGNKAIIDCTANPIVTGTADEFMADDLAGLVIKPVREVQ